MALPPVIQPPQENPITIDATAPVAIPCRRRVRDSPRRIEGTCMAFAPHAARAATEAGAHSTRAERNSNLRFIVPADGTCAATWRERRLRYVPDLRAALGQATACLCIST